MNRDFILELYKDGRSVFKISDVAMMFPEANYKFLSERLRYYVRTGRLLNLRRGVFAKPKYNPQELANILYTPSYISLEYVLQRAGVIFQFQNTITSVSYLSRTLSIDNNEYSYRRIKEEIILNNDGISASGHVNIAVPERAWLDLLYLDRDFYFDTLSPLNKELVLRLLPVYNSAALTERALTGLHYG